MIQSRLITIRCTRNFRRIIIWHVSNQPFSWGIIENPDRLSPLSIPRWIWMVCFHFIPRETSFIYDWLHRISATWLPSLFAIIPLFSIIRSTYVCLSRRQAPAKFSVLAISILYFVFSSGGEISSFGRKILIKRDYLEFQKRKRNPNK